MDNDLIVKSFQRVNENFTEAAAANQDILKIMKKQGKKIRGLRGAVFGLTIFCGILFSRLAERKRSENYLQEQIDDLAARTEKLEVESRDLDCDGGDHDA